MDELNEINGLAEKILLSLLSNSTYVKSNNDIDMLSNRKKLVETSFKLATTFINQKRNA